MLKLLFVIIFMQLL